MKKQLIFIHGGSAYSDYEAFLNFLRTVPLRDLPGVAKRERWTDHLAEDLGDGFEVFQPRMPNSQNAKYLEWKLWFLRYLALVEDEVILVGWSQGGYFLAKYLTEETPAKRVSALYLLAAPFAPDSFGGEDGGDFAFDTTKVGELTGKCGKVTIMHATDDPIVPFSHGENFKKALPEATFVTFSDKGHFLAADFPELIEMVKEG
jgi:uncharacterized protein